MEGPGVAMSQFEALSRQGKITGILIAFSILGCSAAFELRNPSQDSAGTPLSASEGKHPPVDGPSVLPEEPNPPPPSSPNPSVGGVPRPEDFKGLPWSGPIVAQSGQIIENLHITSVNGRCLTVPAGVTNVIIRNNEIGPCDSDDTDVDTDGIRILEDAHHITIQRNVIHDVSSAVTAYKSQNPIVVDRNFVYNIRGPFYRGQMIQMEEVSGGNTSSKITCNIADGNYGNLWRPEDIINLYGTSGVSEGDRIEIAFNRLRGSSTISQNGSGILVGDGAGGGRIWIHDNVVVNVVNVGISIAGGRSIILERNQIYLNHSKSALGMSVRNYSGNVCENHQVLSNRTFALDFMYQGGLPMHYENLGACSNVEEQGNQFGDPTLGPEIFDKVPSECQ